MKRLWRRLLFVCLITTTTALMESSSNPYNVLGVKHSASVPDIKRAFKTLARQLHPDRNKDIDAENKFIALNKAYDLLMDPQRRCEYDRRRTARETHSNETVHGIIGKVVKKILIITDNLSDNITRKEVLLSVSIVLSIGFVVLVGYIMAYLVRVEEESIKEKYRKLGKQMPGVSKPKNDCKLNIHELRCETYNGLVRLLKPFCRTIVLLVDTPSKPKLLPQFYRAVYPYRRNKTLMFAFLLVEKNLDWYRKILVQTLCEQKTLQINPKNCIGTVLSLNGFRKYFCVYHAKHPENSPIPQQLHKRRRGRDSNAAAFIGFDDESNDSASDIEAGILINRKPAAIEDEIIFEEHLLDGLANWLDRLFEAKTQRYHIQYWPEHMK